MRMTLPVEKGIALKATDLAYHKMGSRSREDP